MRMRAEKVATLEGEQAAFRNPWLSRRVVEVGLQTVAATIAAWSSPL
jgi:hypothetical protein